MTRMVDGFRGGVQRLRHAWRSSLGVRVAGALFTVLIVSTVATYLVESRVTQARLNQQAHRVLGDHLDSVTADVLQRQSALTTSVRNVAQTLSLEAGDLPQSDLIGRLGEVRRGLQLDALTVLDERGRPLATVGVPLAGLPGSALDASRSGPIHMLRTMDGRYVQAALVRLTAGGADAFLVGGYLFGDGAAYRLRRVTGNDVVLVAEGQLVGSTLTDPPATPLLMDGSDLPDEPGVVELDGRRTFVQYQSVAPQQGAWAASGAVGVAVPEPVAGLGRSLARIRLGAMVALVLLAGGLAWVLVRRQSRPLLELTHTAGRITAGDLETRFDVQTEDETGLLAATLEGMRQALLRQMDIIGTQTRELAAAGERMVGAQADERRRLARDLHDGVQQRLVVALMRLGALREAARSGDVDAEMVEDLRRDTERALEDLRAFTQTIYPSILEDGGLTPAVHSLAGRCPVSMRVSFEPDPLPRLPGAVEANAYFLVTEAVTNALKHATADRIDVRLHLVGMTLHVAVEDDGVGFDTADSPVPHLEDRARMLGGHCHVRSSPGHGTSVTAILPTVASRPRGDAEEAAAPDEAAVELDDSLRALLERGPR